MALKLPGGYPCQSLTTFDVVDAGEELSWGADHDDGNGIAEASGSNMVIEIV